MEERFDITFLTSLGNTKRIQVKNANLDLPKASITSAFNKLCASSFLPESVGQIAKVQKAQSVSVENNKLF